MTTYLALASNSRLQMHGTLRPYGETPTTEPTEYLRTSQLPPFWFLSFPRNGSVTACKDGQSFRWCLPHEQLRRTGNGLRHLTENAIVAGRIR